MRPIPDFANPRPVVPVGQAASAVPAPKALRPRTVVDVAQSLLGRIAGLSLLALVVVACVCAAHKLIVWSWQ
jgi:hypothetical protein